MKVTVVVIAYTSKIKINKESKYGFVMSKNTQQEMI